MSTLRSDEVGSILKTHRERLGHKLPDVATAICVRTQYLEAIESSCYDDAPAMVYLLGYIRKYAEYLELDAQAMVEQFKIERRSYHQLHEATAVQPIQEDFQPKMPFLIGSAVLLLVVGIGWQVIQRHQHYFNNMVPVPKRIASSIENGLGNIKEDVYKFTQEIHNRKHAEKLNKHEHGIKEHKAKPVPAATAITPEAVKPETTAIPVAKVARSRLVLFAKGKTWVKIIDKNDKLIDQAMLQDGDTYFAPDDKAIRVLAEYPSMIEVYSEDLGTTP